MIPNEPPDGRSKLRPILTTAALLATLVGMVAMIRARVTTDLAIQDFVQYWAAAKLNLQGLDPYDASAMLALERPLGWTESEPNFMYNPPWLLALAAPFACLDYATARTACMVLQFFAIAGLAVALWDDNGGPVRWRWVAVLLAMLAFPSLITIRLGQSSLILLAGFVGFLHWEARGRDFLAGAALALAMVKPHLVYLIWPVVGIWAIRHRRWGVIAGGSAMLGVLTVAAIWPNPQVFGQFLAMIRDRPPARFSSPTLGTFLRMAFGPDQFRLQYVPMLGGLAWLVASRRSWLSSDRSWGERFAPILFASLLTSPYGAWATDMVVLLIPVIGLAASVARDGQPRVIHLALMGWIAIDGLALALGLAKVDERCFIFLTPATWLVYSLVRRATREPGRLPERLGLIAP